MYKAKLVMKSLSQKNGVAFEELVFTLVNMSIIWLVLGLTTRFNLDFQKIYVKLVFFHGYFEE